MPFIILLALQAAPTPTPAPPEPAKRKVEVKFNIDADFFKKHDADKDGALSFNEFQSALEAQMVKAIASEPEVKAKMGQEQWIKFRELLGTAFRGSDVNSDGRLTLAELTRTGKNKGK